MSTTKSGHLLIGCIGGCIALIALVLFSRPFQSPIRAASGVTYTVLAGGMSMTGGIEMVAFAPQTLKVHHGDTVTWKFGAIHNIRFANAPITSLVQMGLIDGKPVGEIDPRVALPNVKSGDSFIAGASAGLHGLPNGDDTFSLVMDTAPGLYSYVCDIHPGMIGFIQVVDDSESISSPDQVAADEQTQLNTAMSDGQKLYVDLADKTAAQPTGDTLNVVASGAQGTTVVHRFFPAVGVIHAGQSVTWTVPAGLVTATVNFLPLKGGNVPLWVQSVTDKAGNLHFLGNIDLMPSATNGDDVSTVSATGILLPGKSFTLRFPNPGVYNYYSAIHEGQSGTIIVLPAASK